jgi:hypothetical protein
MRDNELIHPWKEQFKKTSASTFLLILLVADCVFIFLHFLLVFTPLLNTKLFFLARDHGYPEIYQYVKELWIVVLLLSILIKTRALGYSVWALLFLYLLFDDALEIHETFGGYIATRPEFTPFLGLRAQDFGELAVSAVAAASLLAPLILFYIRGLDPFRQVTRHLLLFLLALAFFGVFVDMLHIPSKIGWNVVYLLVAVEDGGEMVVMSFIAWYVYLLNVRDGNIGISLRSPR